VAPPERDCRGLRNKGKGIGRTGGRDDSNTLEGVSMNIAILIEHRHTYQFTIKYVSPLATLQIIIELLSCRCISTAS